MEHGGSGRERCLKSVMSGLLVRHRRVYSRDLALVIILTLGLRPVCVRAYARWSFFLVRHLMLRSSLSRMCDRYDHVRPCHSEVGKIPSLESLVVCHSIINAHVLRVRLRGHDLWFLTTMCKGYDGTWVPSTLVASRFMFPRRYRNRYQKWLVYCKHVDKVYCKLFKSSTSSKLSLLASKGLNDRKHISQRLKQHENGVKIWLIWILGMNREWDW